MSLANKFGIPESLLDAAKKAMDEANEYQKKVQAHMAKKGIKSLNDLTGDQKKKFFNDLDAMHTAKNEEVEPVEEAESHQAKTTMKHIKNPTQGEKDASKKMKSGIAGYRDRIAMLHSAKARGALKKEEVELTQEDLDFIASLNQAEVVEGQLRNFSPHSDLAGRGRLSGYNKTAAGKKREYDRETERLKDKMKFTKSQGGIAGPKGKLPEEFELDEGSGSKEKQHDKYVDRDSEESKEKVKGARERMASDEKAKAGKKLLDKIKLKKEDVSLDDFTVEEIEEYMQTEEFAQLDELSKETLGSYIKKRQHDVAAQGAITRQHAVDAEKAKKDNNYSQQRKSNEKSDKAFAKGWNYRQNISRAVDKIVKKA